MQAENEGNLFFVYRTHYEGPLSKRVRRLPDRDVLHWFQRGWLIALGGGDYQEWVKKELGGRVYGLDSIFEAAQEKRLPLPRTWRQLRDLLDQHLYVEGEIRMDARSLRVKTDDEVDLAYFFFEASLSKERPDRLAYLIHQDWKLPDGEGTGVFQPDPPIHVMGSAGTGDGATYCVFLTFDSSESFYPYLYFIPGVRLPELPAYMREVTPQSIERHEERYSWQETWPFEMLVLRALLEPEENDLRGALERCNVWPAFDLELPSLEERLKLLDYPIAYAAMRELRDQHPDTRKRNPELTLIQQTIHLAQMSIHLDDFFGYQQLFLFDDLWASAHPDLAQSLLWYSYTWDILQKGRTKN